MNTQRSARLNDALLASPEAALAPWLPVRQRSHSRSMVARAETSRVASRSRGLCFTYRSEEQRATLDICLAKEANRSIDPNRQGVSEAR